MQSKQQDYRRARTAGYTATEAKCIADAIQRFTSLGEDVRLTSTVEDEGYFDVYGTPEGYTTANGQKVTAVEATREIARSIALFGCWRVVAEYRTEEDPHFSRCDQWEIADTIGMCVYENPLCPFENAYVADLMNAACDALEQHRDKMGDSDDYSARLDSEELYTEPFDLDAGNYRLQRANDGTGEVLLIKEN